MLLSIITWLRYIFNNKSKVMVLITSGISIVAMMLVKSSTATIVAILVSVGVFYLTYKKANKFKYEFIRYFSDLWINLVTNPIYMTHCLKIEWFTFYPTLLRTIISCVCMTISFTLIAKH